MREESFLQRLIAERFGREFGLKFFGFPLPARQEGNRWVVATFGRGSGWAAQWRENALREGANVPLARDSDGKFALNSEGKTVPQTVFSDPQYAPVKAAERRYQDIYSRNHKREIDDERGAMGLPRVYGG